ETQETRYFDDYTTEAKEIKGYALKQTPVNAAGKIDADETVVTYVYALKDSSVTANYVDENGKEIAASETTTGKYFEKYTTYPKDILGYELIASSENAEGVREEDVIQVYYTYKLKDSTVVVRYVDINGNEIAESETLNGKVFEAYKTEAKQINGYELTMMPGNANGTFAENQQTVNYVYALKGSGVVANYVDEAGNKLAESVAQYGNVFDKYSTSAKEIKGYELVSVPENAQGELTEELIVVNYVYKLKDSKLIIRYVDEEGNEIAESDVVNGKVFESYSTTAKSIYEYQLISSTNNTSGEMTEEDILIVYTYKKVLNIDTDGDGEPDLNIDPDKDGKPDINIDTDDDGKPDVNIDTDKDGKPDVNIDTDKDGKPDVNVDTDKDGKPDINIDTDDDGKPDINIDTDGDGKPDINIDTDGDGKPDINIDTNGDGKPDINIDTDGDGKPDVNIDIDGDGKPDINIDTDNDGKADINIDTDGDSKPDVNIDTDKDGKPDINIDTDDDGKADINIDTDGDGKADLNLDLDGDGIADANIDTNGDGIADKNIIGAVDTGSSDMFKMIMYASISIVAAFLIIVLMFKNKKKEKEA
ncbi:MAG: MucBP domain-containing protein, partial [Eubacterium sp.]|nr:MucBP domain-containing protein [Eubacterium sp.]